MERTKISGMMEDSFMSGFFCSTCVNRVIHVACGWDFLIALYFSSAQIYQNSSILLLVDI